MQDADHSKRLSPKEVAALAGVSEKAVRSEIEDGIVQPETVHLGNAVRRRFRPRDVYYFTLLRRFPLPLPIDDRRALYRIIHERLPAAGRWRKVDRGLRLADLVTVATGPIAADFRAALGIYRHGRDRTERREDILGGEPVFRGTRIAVRHVGAMANAGISSDEILADFPALTGKDIAYASLVAGMKPKPGRPPGRLRFAKTPA